jgi:BarA-like signal transduction histidine kinase
MKKVGKIFLSFCLLSFALTVLSDIRPPKIIAQDKAIFRIENQIYFSHDINKTFSGLRKLSCIKKSYLLRGLSISKNDLNNQKLQKNIIKKILPYYKLQTLVLKKSAMINAKELERTGLIKCFGKNISSWSQEEKILARSEFFLRNKFYKLISEKELSLYFNNINNSISHLPFY